MDLNTVRRIGYLSDEVAGRLTGDDLRRLTNEMADTLLALVAGCQDADVVYEPADPAADDPYAVTGQEVHMPWTLGHVIMHATASAEESATLAAEMARGVAFHGRSRYETPWQEVRTIDGCRRRIEESRRMRLASLDMWPDEPHLENRYQAWPHGPVINAVGRFLLGLAHEDGHLDQVREIIRQATAARPAAE